MAKSDLNFKIGADGEKALNQMAKVIAKQEESIMKLKKANTEAKASGRSFKESSTHAGGMASKVGEIAAGVLSAAAAMKGFSSLIKLAGDEWTDYKRKQDEAARTSMTFAEDFSLVISTWKGPEFLNQSEQVFGDIVSKNKNLSQTKMTQMLDALTGANPSISIPRAASTISKAAGTVGWEESPEFLSLVGELQEMYPTKSDNDIFDLAAGMRSDAGKRRNMIANQFKNVQKMNAMGISPDTALGTMMAGFEVEQDPRALSGLVSVLGMPRNKIQATPGRKLSPEQIARNQIADMSNAEYFQWMAENPEAAAEITGSSWGTIAPLFKNKGAIARGTETINKYQSDDVFDTRSAAFAKSKLGGGQILPGIQTQASVEAMQIDYEGGQIGLIRQMIMDILSASPNIGPTQRKLLTGIIEAKGLIGGDYADSAIQELMGVQRNFADPTRTLLDRPVGSLEFIGSSTQPNPSYDPAMAKIISELIDNIKQMTAATKENTAATQQSGLGTPITVAGE